MVLLTIAQTLLLTGDDERRSRARFRAPFDCCRSGSHAAGCQRPREGGTMLMCAHIGR